ncbi:hypothetical protein VTN77DRAFT_5358 [Rasamsonia byssochlamydoides]|uniref:uncharacterized protein n=1 Tax=Rasamsonia byssochlamydoides TaxID=89139 RepID=UPI0037448EB7
MSSAKRSIIVTGGASGIGLGITRSLASSHPETTHISIFDINASAGAQSLSTLQKEIPDASFSFHQCDVSSWESQAAAFEEVYAQQGRIDHVFANAGITEKGKLIVKDEEKPEKPDLATLNVNLVGVIYSVKLAIHYLLKNPPSSISTGPPTRGSIICTASNAGLYPFPIAPIYSTAKHAVVGLVRSLARPLALENIQINALAPAVIETNISSDLSLFKSMIITPMSTATRAVDTLLSDPSLTGKIAELNEEKVTFAEPPAYVDENTGRNIEMFWTLGYA